jgi:hypothetical protein
MLVAIILTILILHFVVGFGYLVYKLSPRKKEIISSADETILRTIDKN